GGHLETGSGTGTLRGVWAVPGSAGEAFAVGDGGAILHRRSSDGVWERQSSSTSHNLFAVSGSDALHLVAVGDMAQSFLRSADGGATWLTVANNNLAAAPLFGVWMSVTGVVFAVGQPNTVRASNDFGASWSAGTLLGADSNHPVLLASVWGVGLT